MLALLTLSSPRGDIRKSKLTYMVSTLPFSERPYHSNRPACLWEKKSGVLSEVFVIPRSLAPSSAAVGGVYFRVEDPGPICFNLGKLKNHYNDRILSPKTEVKLIHS